MVSKSSSSSFSELFRSSSVQISFLIYICIQGILLYQSDVNSSLMGDASMYYENSLSFLEKRPYAFFDRLPFYPCVLSCILWIFGKNNLTFCVIFQFILHIGLAFFAFKIANLILPKWKNSVFILVLLNPCSIFHTHVLITETLYAFLFGVAYYWLLKGASQKHWLSILGSGLFVGLMALTRPEAKFLLYLLPFAVFYFFIVFHHLKQNWRSLFFISLFAFGIGYLITMPWQVYLSHQISHHNIDPSQKQFDHISFTLAILENLAQGKDDLIETYTSIVIPKGDEAFLKLPNHSEMTLHEKHNFLNHYYFKQLLTYSPSLYARAFLHSWSMIYLASGSQILMNLLHQENSIPKDFQHKPNILKNMIQQIKMTPLSFSITTFLFLINFFLRILDLVGLFSLFINKHYKFLFVSVPPVLFVTFISLFDGQSRSRLSLEPILMIWAVYGFILLKEKGFKIFKRISS
ncbi:MAG: hypothetical protein JSS34_06925 [Proteobacteria bacterium]|nr:hypothetical protein [Pseudomonadota bacterium]